MKIKTRILTADSSFPTARLIRDSIEEQIGKKFFITSNPNEYLNVIFRYGNSAKVMGTDTCYNSRSFIQLASNKLEFSNFCREKGIYSPIFYTHDILPKSYPVVIRSTLTGWGGKGISFAENEEQFRSAIKPGYYWTKFVRCTYEIRVHLFDTNPNRIYKKVRDESAVPFPIRNSENGYHFSLQSEDSSGNRYKKAKEIANQLGQAFVEIGGHFSGIDMGYDPEKKDYFVFEANSAPGLNPNNAHEYAKFLINSLKLGEKQNVLEENAKDEVN